MIIFHGICPKCKQDHSIIMLCAPAMNKSHEDHYVQTKIGVHTKHMSFASFMSTSAAIMSNCDDMESALYWYSKAVKDGMVFG